MDKYTHFWDKELFTVRVFPDIMLEKNSDYKKRRVFATLLSHADTFNQLIIEARKTLRLNKTLPLSEKPTIEEILSLESKYFSTTGQFALEDLASGVCSKYHLPEIWLLPIKVLIMTNVLYVLPDSSITFHFPVVDRNPALSRVMLLKATPPFNGLSDAISAYRLSRKPAIIINEKISPGKLADLIRQNSESIEKLIASIGQSTISQAKEKTLFWGTIAAIFIDEGITSWSDMDKIIDSQSADNPFQTDTKDPILSNPADKTELQTCYKNFMASLNKVAS